MLRDRAWKLKYTPEDGDLVRVFYVPALEDALRYDRLTGYFNAGALALAARGIEGLVHNKGKMRLVVGCTLKEAEIDAIQQGAELRTQVERRLTELPLKPPDTDAANALELLAWMIGRGHLDVKVAVPCDEKRRPVDDPAIFHEKSGIIEDHIGNKLAWTGSLNETEAGWQSNWESINVFTSWGREPKRVSTEEQNFERLWSDSSPRAIVLDVPDAVREDLLRFLPSEGRPAVLKKTPEPSPSPLTARQQLIWSFIKHAPSLPNGGSRTGEATAAVTPWPHQVRAFERLYRQWPPKLLIADEVGLGKTIQAGLLLRQSWLAGQAKRILILAPKAVLKQWQIELREKFNLNWPIYDGRNLHRYQPYIADGKAEHKSPREPWHEEPVVIASSQLMRRKDRFKTLVEDAKPWDLIVLDEAHHARRRAAGSVQEGGPNTLLKLMRSLKARTDGLVLMTATPMQVHPIEVWDLLDLLGLPPEWAASDFLDFFEQVNKPSPSGAALDRMARMFKAIERNFGQVSGDAVQSLTGLSRLKAKRLLSALRDEANIPRRLLDNQGRRAAIAVMRAHTPIRRLVSRHTRELLRRYQSEGVLSTAIAKRQVNDHFGEMSSAEFALYEAVDEYISRTYSRATRTERSAVGFVMTVYRRRLASSFAALRATLEKRRDARLHDAVVSAEDSKEDTPDDEALDDMPDMPDEEEVAAIASRALAFEEIAEIERLLESIQSLPPDSKLDWLTETLEELALQGYGQVMVFTQYTDTMDFLRESLRSRTRLRLMCFSGRGGEVPSAAGQSAWLRIDREQVKRRFRDGEADVLLCTDAAAEGLNFQFCGALVNYDMPWNPMRVEQRIGRIDRVGQHHESVRVVNLHYKNTVETDVYQALRKRIGLFEQVVGRLQPILARMPKAITSAVLAGRKSTNAQSLADGIQRQVADEERNGFDLDAGLEFEVAMPDRPPSPITMDDLDRVLRDPDLMPPDTQVQPLGTREYGLFAPSMQEPIRVTTDPEYYEENSESVELWSPGNPFFKVPEPIQDVDVPVGTTLKDLLET